jgi:hypothetical protein
MKSRVPSREMITLKGWVAFSTEKAVKWHDSKTGYELWFPLSAVRIAKKQISVPKSLYLSGVKMGREGDIDDARQNQLDDLREEVEFRAQMKKLGVDVRKSSGCAGPLLVAVLIVAAVAVVVWKFKL